MAEPSYVARSPAEEIELSEGRGLPEAKPCPFCGMSVARVAGVLSLTVICSRIAGGCGASSGFEGIVTELEALERWNARAE